MVNMNQQRLLRSIAERQKKPFLRGSAYTFKENVLGYDEPLTEVLSTNDKLYTATFVVSTSREDRDGDIVVPEGCDLTDYLRSPIWMFGHGHAQEGGWAVPIGRGYGPNAGIRIERSRIIATCQFDEQDPDSVFLYQKVCRGYLNATSIAFIPLEAERRSASKAQSQSSREGWIFRKWSLTEISIVAVPANADAIRLGASPALAKSIKAQLKFPYWSESMNTKAFFTSLAKTIAPHKGASVKANKDGSFVVRLPGATKSLKYTKTAAMKLKDCVSDKIAKLVEEGKDQEQAAAIAYSMCGEGKSQKQAEKYWGKYFKAVHTTVDEMKKITSQQLQQEYDGASGDEWTQLRTIADRAGRGDLVRICIDMATEAYEEEDKSLKSLKTRKAADDTGGEPYGAKCLRELVAHMKDKGSSIEQPEVAKFYTKMMVEAEKCAVKAYPEIDFGFNEEAEETPEEGATEEEATEEDDTEKEENNEELAEQEAEVDNENVAEKEDGTYSVKLPDREVAGFASKEEATEFARKFDEAAPEKVDAIEEEDELGAPTEDEEESTEELIDQYRSKSVAYDRGLRAGQNAPEDASTDRQKNPYSSGTTQYEDWQRGYEEATGQKSKSYKGKFKRITKASAAKVMEAAEHMEDIASADDMPKRYKGGLKYHAKELKEIADLSGPQEMEDVPEEGAKRRKVAKGNNPLNLRVGEMGVLDQSGMPKKPLRITAIDSDGTVHLEGGYEADASEVSRPGGRKSDEPTDSPEAKRLAQLLARANDSFSKTEAALFRLTGVGQRRNGASNTRRNS